MGPVLVFGHRNPDNDSICSAVAYAHLKNLTDADNVYVPARLGAVPRETAWAFERWGLELPIEIAHVHTTVRDAMTEGAVTISADKPMLDAGRLLREHDVRALPVTSDDGTVVGLISQRTLAERYLESTEIVGFTRTPVSARRLVRVLEGTLLTGEETTTLTGRVLIGAAEPETMVAMISPGDTLIVGDRRRTQPMALEAGVACLVVTTGSEPGADALEAARERGAAVIVTSHDTYSAARLVALATAVGDAMDTDVLFVGPDTLLSEATEDLFASVHREAVVVDPERNCLGVLTRTDLARGVRKRVVLVDHNESSQSAAGVEEASVVEIVDHHRVGDIQTAGPILFLNLPVGSTATIVALRYEQLGIETPPAMAGILLGALLTDTVILKSPTTTRYDREVCERLAVIAGVDPLEYGMELFRSRSAGEVFSAAAVVGADVKEYRVGEVSAAIAQYETVDAASTLQHAAEIEAALEAMRTAKGCDVAVLMLTDVVREGSQIFAAGKVRLAERALGISLAAGPVWMDGVLSRKKQVAARIVSGSAS